MADREITDVVDQIKTLVPQDKIEFIGRLDWVYQDACCRPPEDRRRSWEYLQQCLLKFIGLYPNEDWQFQVLSVFSTVTVEEIKEDVARLTGAV